MRLSEGGGKSACTSEFSVTHCHVTAALRYSGAITRASSRWRFDVATIVASIRFSQCGSTIWRASQCNAGCSVSQRAAADNARFQTVKAGLAKKGRRLPSHPPTAMNTSGRAKARVATDSSLHGRHTADKHSARGVRQCSPARRRAVLANPASGRVPLSAALMHDDVGSEAQLEGVDACSDACRVRQHRP